MTLKRLFCKHEYDPIAKAEVFADDDTTETPMAHKLVCVREKCLKIKIVKH